MKSKYLQASVFAADCMEQFVEDGKLKVGEGTFAEFVIQHASGVSMVPATAGLSETGQNRYEVSNGLANVLEKLAQKDPQFFDAVAHICAWNISISQPVPSGLESFAALTITGSLGKPRPRGPKRQKRFWRAHFLYAMTHIISDKFDIALTRNESTDGKSACDIVAEALRTCGYQIQASELVNHWTHPDWRRARLEFEAAVKITAISRKNQDLPARIGRGLLDLFSENLEEKIERRKKVDDDIMKQILSTFQ